MMDAFEDAWDCRSLPLLASSSESLLRSLISARFSSVFGSEQQRQAPKDFTQSRRREDPDTLAEPAPVNGAKLRDIHHAGAREPGFTVTETYVSGHILEPEIGSDGRDNGSGDRAAVEPIVLYHQSRPVPRWLRALRSAEV